MAARCLNRGRFARHKSDLARSMRAHQAARKRSCVGLGKVGFAFHCLPTKYAFCYCPIVKYLSASVSIGFSRQMKKPMREFRLTLTGTYLS